MARDLPYPVSVEAAYLAAILDVQDAILAELRSLRVTPGAPASAEVVELREPAPAAKAPSGPGGEKPRPNAKARK